MKKIKFQFNGMTFQLPYNSARKDSYDGVEYIHMGAKHTASVIKQYVKQKFGKQITVWSTSDVYSGGSSVRINICSKNGFSVSDEIYQDIENFTYNFKAGRFDGMYDIYEYRNDEVKSDNGTQLKYFPSYIFVENKPKWGTVEYYLQEWKNFDASNYNCPMPGNTTWEQFINFYSSGMKKGILEKVSPLQNEVR